MTNQEKFIKTFGYEIMQRDTGEAIPGHCKILIAADKHFDEWLKQEYVPPMQPDKLEDTVYRKAVQRLLAYFVPKERYVEAVDGLRGLPSAQPVEDIRAMCGECDAWNQYKNYPHPGWIPCSTALPSKYDNYLITTEDGMVVFGVYDPRERQWCRYDKIKSWWLYGIKVLAWMPLPKPWEGEKDDG